MQFKTRATSLFSFDNKGDRITIDADDDVYNALKHTDFPEFLLEDPDCWFLEAENGVIVKKEPEHQDPSPEPLAMRAPLDLPQLEEPNVQQLQDQAIGVPSRPQSHPSTYEIDDNAEAGPSRAPASAKGKRPLYSASSSRLAVHNHSEKRVARQIRFSPLANLTAPKKTFRCTLCQHSSCLHFSMHEIHSHIKGGLASFGSVDNTLTRISIRPELNPKLPNSLFVVSKRKVKLCMGALTSGVIVPLFVCEGPDRWLFYGNFQIVEVRQVEEDSVFDLFGESELQALSKAQRASLVTFEKGEGPFYHVVLKHIDVNCPIPSQRSLDG